MAFAILLNSCKKDEDDVTNPPDVNEEELITSMILTFTDSSGIEILKTVAFRDIDGEGGNGPIQFDTIRLSANTTYYSNIILLNETVTPPDTISNEVKEEGDEHLFCFEPAMVDIDIKRTDSDGMFEIGLESTWRAGSAGNGKVKVSLKHQPDGLKTGSCDPGETDVEVAFETIIN